MNRNYIVLTVIAVALAIGMLMMDRTKKPKEIEPVNLAIAYNDPSRFLTVDEVTDRLVKKDPGMVLIDVRPADQYKGFAIPGAINIPVDSLLTDQALDILRKKELDKVIYSNSDVLSDQAWILCTRLSLPGVFVLEGGVNNWFKSIVQGTEPLPGSPNEAFDLYSFRQAAYQYFYGAKETPQLNTAENSPKPKPVEKKVEIQRVEPAVESGGGC